MIARQVARSQWPILLGALVAACLAPGTRAAAQDADSSYRTSEQRKIEHDANGHTLGPADPVALSPRAGVAEEPSAPPDSQNTGPVRLARFAAVSGNVTWRPDEGSEWSPATANLPIRQGAQVWVTNGGHADVQFDDGSELRLGNKALAILKTLYSDKDGEFTQISLNDGLATLYSRHDNAVYQIDTPATSVKCKGASQIRVGVDGGSEITVQRGDATIEGPQGATKLHVSDYVYLADSHDSVHIRTAPAADNWDRWNDDRNRIVEGRPNRHVPPNIGLVSGELDEYGTWREDPANGWVWCPRVSSPDWRPYNDGHWTWVDPFGWTWVSNEPWGWAPYHYGTWVHSSYGWGWCPGPVHQYWSPAVVSFSVYDGYVAWAPLCPWEVRYPSAFSFGFWGRDWALSFSIGSCGVYYPFGGFCIGRPFNTFFVNHFDRFRGHDFGREFGRGFGSPTFDRFSRTNEFAAANSHFIPFNSRRAAGGSLARLDSFGGRGRYQALSTAQSSYFARGRTAATPSAGRSPVAGPPSVQPTASARTPSRTFVSGAQPAALQRQVYHAQTPIAARGGSPASTGSMNSGTGSLGSSAQNGASSGTARGGIESGRTPSSQTGVTGARGGLPTDRGQSSVGSSVGSLRSRSGDGRVSAAEAARAARSSLGMGGRESGSLTRSDSGVSGSGRGSGSAGGDAFGRGRPGGTGYGNASGSAGRSSTGGGSNRPYGGDSGTTSPRSGTGGYRTGGGYYLDNGGGYSSGRSRANGGDYTSGSSGTRTGGDNRPGASYPRSSGSSGPGSSYPRSGGDNRSGRSGDYRGGDSGSGRSGGGGGGRSGGSSEGGRSEGGGGRGRSGR